MPTDVKTAITSNNFKNYSVFHYNGVLFTYFEYNGSDLKGDLSKMTGSSAVKTFNSQFKDIIDGEWLTMDSCYSLE